MPFQSCGGVLALPEAKGTPIGTRTLLGTSASLLVTSALLVVTRTLCSGLALLLGARTLRSGLPVSNSKSFEEFQSTHTSLSQFPDVPLEHATELKTMGACCIACCMSVLAPSSFLFLVAICIGHRPVAEKASRPTRMLSLLKTRKGQKVEGNTTHTL